MKHHLQKYFTSCTILLKIVRVLFYLMITIDICISKRIEKRIAGTI